MRTAWGAAAAGLATLLAGCQHEPMGGSLKLTVEESRPVSALQRIHEGGRQCWFGGGEGAFGGLAMVPELDTDAGRPRLLMLRKGRSEGLPVLVIEADGSPVTISSYGPLAGTATGARINRDIMRWFGGALDC